MIRRTARLGLAASLMVGGALGACTEDPTPGNEPSSTSEGDTTAGPSTSMATTAASTDEGTTEPGATGPASTGPASTGPEPEPTDCDALREQGACEAVSGADFECVWFPEAYPATLDGESCAVGEAIGWCLAAYTLGDTGCVDDFVYSCPDDGTADSLFVRVADDDTLVLIQDAALAGIDFACGEPTLWEACNGTEGPAACQCGCDPGLPQ